MKKTVRKAKRRLRRKSCLLIDSTGYSIGYALRRYGIRKQRKKRYRLYLSKGYKPAERKKHVKHAILVDKYTKLILSQRVRAGPSSDQPDFIPLLEDRPEFIEVDDVIADAGYDAEKHHRYVVFNMKARCTIPPLQGPVRKHKGKSTTFRQRMLARFPRQRYRQRSIVESCISVIKRRTGGVSVSIRNDLRYKEALLRGVVYDIYRLIRLSFN